MNEEELILEAAKWGNIQAKKAQSHYDYPSGVHFGPELDKLYQQVAALGYRSDNPRDVYLFDGSFLFKRSMKIVVNYEIRPEIAYLVAQSIHDYDLFFENIHHVPEIREAWKIVTVETLTETLAKGLDGSQAVLAAAYPERYLGRLLEAQALGVHKGAWEFIAGDYDLAAVMEIVNKGRWWVDDFLEPMKRGFTPREVELFGPIPLISYPVEDIRSITVNPTKFSKIFHNLFRYRSERPSVFQIERAMNLGMDKTIYFTQTAKEMGIKPRFVAMHFDAIIAQWEENQSK